MFSFPEAGLYLSVIPYRCDPSREAGGASIDTRTLKPLDLFIALKGSRQDGHDFLEEAFLKGASGALMAESFLETHRPFFDSKPLLFRNLLAVPDPEKGMTQLASWQRSRFDLPAVGITGSVGKTSTKEFLSYLLEQRFTVLSSRGNFNNYLGLPLTLLGLDRRHQVCIAELGANHAGEIRSLSRLLKPTLGIITQISPAHLEGFGSLDGIYRAKLELFENLPREAYAVIPDDDPRLYEETKKLSIKCVRVGTSGHSDYRVSGVHAKEGYVSFTVNGCRQFAFPGIAPFLAKNAALAVACADLTGYPLGDIPEVWQDCKLPSGRFQESWIGEIRVIYDGYNASPSSFQKALETFDQLPVTGRKIVIFSDMLELGSEEMKYHEDLGRTMATYDFDGIFSYGKRSRRTVTVLHHMNHLLDARHFENAGETAHFLKEFVEPGDCLLLKASRGMKIEDVLQEIRSGAVGKDGGIDTTGKPAPRGVRAGGDKSRILNALKDSSSIKIH